MFRAVIESTSKEPGAERAEVASDRPCFRRLLLVALLVVIVLPLLPPRAAPAARACAEGVPPFAGDTAATPPGGDEVPPPTGANAAEETVDAGSPWAFGLGLYFWLPAVDADLSSGTNDASIDASVLELFEATEGILTLGGHFEGWWNRIGLYINGGYFYLDFEDQETKGGDAGVLTEIGLLEYSAMFRITGARAGEEVAGWAEKSGPPRVDLHAGGLTTWLRNDIDPEGTPGASNDVVLTSPLLGARATVDISPRWVFHLEGSVGGFGVDDVEFAGEGLATFGYRTKLFGAPMALSLGYKVLCLDVDSQRGEERVKSDFLFHGPLIDLTFSW